MYKIFVFLLLIIFPLGSATDISALEAEPSVSGHEELYAEMKLDGIINYDAFDLAMTGYEKIESKKKDIITIIDYSKPSTEERFYVLDIKNRKLLFTTYVAHGKKSGENYATSFSNKEGSHQSSLGFFITENTYSGGNGYSLLINGLEYGINHNAKKRAVVIHGADYSNPAIIPSAGRLGRSFGCPALPRSVNKEVIDTIKDGSVLFIYANDDNYIAHSDMLKQHTEGTILSAL